MKNATEDDQVEYTCSAANVKSSSKLKTEVMETPPKITVDKKEYRIKKGDDVTMEVKFSAIPEPKDEWTVKGKVIKKTKRTAPKVTESSAMLTIFKVEEDDVGNYSLKLKNNCGEASAELKLIIMGKWSSISRRATRVHAKYNHLFRRRPESTGFSRSRRNNRRLYNTTLEGTAIGRKLPY